MYAPGTNRTNRADLMMLLIGVDRKCLDYGQDNANAPYATWAIDGGLAKASFARAQSCLYACTCEIV